MTYWIGFSISVISFFSCCICAYIDIKFEQENPDPNDKNASNEKKEFKLIRNNIDKVTINPLEAIKEFKLEYWLCSIIYCLGMSSIYPYINFSSEFLFKTKFSKIIDKHLAEIESDMFTGVCFIICGFIDPFMGYVQKRFGMRPHLLLFSCLLGIVAISLFYISPLIGIINLGLSNSILLTVFWTTVGLTCTKKNEVCYFLIDFYLIFNLKSRMLLIALLVL